MFEETQDGMKVPGSSSIRTQGTMTKNLSMENLVPKLVVTNFGLSTSLKEDRMES